MLGLYENLAARGGTSPREDREAVGGSCPTSEAPLGPRAGGAPGTPYRVPAAGVLEMYTTGASKVVFAGFRWITRLQEMLLHGAAPAESLRATLKDDALYVKSQGAGLLANCLALPGPAMIQIRRRTYGNM